MTKEKLLELFNKEKTRLTEQVFNPIFSVINSPKYDKFFEYFTLFNINLAIKNSKSDVPELQYHDGVVDEMSHNPDYKTFYDKFNNQIFEILNFDVFKIVFGISNYQEWALNFFKFLIYSFYESYNLTNVELLISNNVLDLDNYDLTQILSSLSDLIFKTVYGFTFTSIDKYDYWANTTGISQEQYNLFSDIVNKNNPALFLVNSILYYNNALKNDEIGSLVDAQEMHLIHNVDSFTPAKQISIIDKNAAWDIIINYFAAITLYSKLEVSLWKSIQNLVFGTTSGKKVIVMRTITEINVNINSVWQLDSNGLLFFKLLKYQALFSLGSPSSITSFLSQDMSVLTNTVLPTVNKFEKIKKILDAKNQQKE